MNIVTVTLTRRRRPERWKPTITLVEHDIGEVIYTETIEAANLRTTAGVDFCADRLSNAGSPPPPVIYMALSTNATPPTTADTTLTSELATLGFTRAAATYAHVSGATQYTLAHTFTATGTFTNIQKQAIFTASSGGIMVASVLFDQGPKSGVNGDTLTVTHGINF